jgi:hypothetical protein
VCVVWAPRVVTRSKPTDKFGECSEPAGELHMGVLLTKRRNDLLGFSIQWDNSFGRNRPISEKKTTWRFYNLALMLMLFGIQ